MHKKCNERNIGSTLLLFRFLLSYCLIKRFISVMIDGKKR